MLYQTRICCNICPRLPGGAFSQVPLFNIDIGVNIITVCHFIVVGWLIKLVALYMKTFRNTQSFPTKYVILWILPRMIWRLLMLSGCLGLLSGCSILGKLSVNFFCLECPLCLVLATGRMIRWTNKKFFRMVTIYSLGYTIIAHRTPLMVFYVCTVAASPTHESSQKLALKTNWPAIWTCMPVRELLFLW